MVRPEKRKDVSEGIVAGFLEQCGQEDKRKINFVEKIAKPTGGIEGRRLIDGTGRRKRREDCLVWVWEVGRLHRKNDNLDGDLN